MINGVEIPEDFEMTLTLNGSRAVVRAADLENVQFSTPCDLHDVTPVGGKATVHELGKSHLHLSMDFMEGKRPLWRKLGGGGP